MSDDDRGGDGEDWREARVEVIFFEENWREGKAGSRGEGRVVFGSTREESDWVIPREEDAPGPAAAWRG